jgi:3-oxoacyl-(acyl-carrier-protein) synthase
LGQVEEDQLEQTVQYCNVNGEFSYDLLGSKGIKLINPILPVRSLPNTGLGMISIIFGFKGANMVVSSSESETGMLIDEAVQAIAEGLIDVCLVGGADAPFGVGVMGNLIWQAQQWAETSNQSITRDLQLAEGAVFLVLEAKEHAVVRGQSIYGSIGQAVSVNLSQPEQEYEQVAKAYRDMMGKQLATEKCDAVITAEREFGYLQQVEKDFWNSFEHAKINRPQKLVSYHKNIGYMVSSAQIMDISHACLIMKEQTAKFNAVLINGQGLSGGISSIIVQGI